MHLVVILPAFDEEKTIKSVIGKIPNRIEGIDIITTIVVDDGSVDNTAGEAENAGATVIRHHKNRGLGEAIRTGMIAALDCGADIMVNIDADGQFNPEDIIKLIEPIVKNQTDFVTASRFIDSSLTPDIPLMKRWGNKALAWLISSLSGKNFYDVSCGFRAYSGETLLKLNLYGKFTYTHETFLDLVFKDMNIIELPVKVSPQREHGNSRVSGNPIKYGLKSLKIALRCFKDYKPLKLFGSLASLIFLIGFCFGLFFVWHYLLTGKFSPQLWAGFISGFLMALSFLIAVLALIGDMLARIRFNQEEILYMLKKKYFMNRNNCKRD